MCVDSPRAGPERPQQLIANATGESFCFLSSAPAEALCPRSNCDQWMRRERRTLSLLSIDSPGDSASKTSAIANANVMAIGMRQSVSVVRWTCVKPFIIKSPMYCREQVSHPRAISRRSPIRLLR